MRTVPIYSACLADAGVRAVFGDDPRVYPFGKAAAGVASPYATWQIITGAPESYLAERPDIDSATIQVDIYADADDQLIAGVVALRDLLESQPGVNIARWGDEDTDPDTGARHRSFDVDWWVRR